MHASFGKYAIGENVVAGNAMSRRLPTRSAACSTWTPRAMITCGIGVLTRPGPAVSCISPADGIAETGTRRDIARRTFEFLYTPDTEAAEEMHIWIPQLRALTRAENANH